MTWPRSCREAVAGLGFELKSPKSLASARTTKWELVPWPQVSGMRWEWVWQVPGHLH